MSTQENVLENLWHMFNKFILLNEYHMKQRLESYKPSEVHCIEYIGKNESSNVTKLAENFYMTRGAISKLTKKLIAKGLIESYQKSENKKEIYYRLTESGWKIFKIHEDMHTEFIRRDETVFNNFSKEELDTIIRFAKQYNLHLNNKIIESGIDSRAGGFEKI